MKTVAGDFPDTYQELAGMYMPRPIHGEKDYKRAARIIDRLAGHDLSRDQEDYLLAVSLFVEAYEDDHHPIKLKPVTPLEALRILVEERGMSASELGRLLGNRTLGSALLRGDRDLSKTHIRILADYFKIEPGYFITG
ncbi:MAG: hypothetical protein HY804_10665 [Nitrospinae bacterium]|nr:hypothetical protein [Nitrospinota bacterium]